MKVLKSVLWLLLIVVAVIMKVLKSVLWLLLIVVAVIVGGYFLFTWSAI